MNRLMEASEECLGCEGTEGGTGSGKDSKGA